MLMSLIRPRWPYSYTLCKLAREAAVWSVTLHGKSNVVSEESLRKGEELFNQGSIPGFMVESVCNATICSAERSRDGSRPRCEPRWSQVGDFGPFSCRPKQDRKRRFEQICPTGTFLRQSTFVGSAKTLLSLFPPGDVESA